MKKILWAIILFAGGTSTGWAWANWQQAAVQNKSLLENERVAVTEYTFAPKSIQASYPRSTDQLIVFLDDAEYDATDGRGQVQHKMRKRGEIVWHDKGEMAPTLFNTGKKPFRNVVIGLK